MVEGQAVEVERRRVGCPQETFRASRHPALRAATSLRPAEIGHDHGLRRTAAPRAIAASLSATVDAPCPRTSSRRRRRTASARSGRSGRARRARRNPASRRRRSPRCEAAASITAIASGMFGSIAATRSPTPTPAATHRLLQPRHQRREFVAAHAPLDLVLAAERRSPSAARDAGGGSRRSSASHPERTGSRASTRRARTCGRPSRRRCRTCPRQGPRNPPVTPRTTHAARRSREARVRRSFPQRGRSAGSADRRWFSDRGTRAACRSWSLLALNVRTNCHRPAARPRAAVEIPPASRRCRAGRVRAP